MNSVAIIVIGYLVGSISFSYILGKLLRGIDIREYDSGNAGATNTFRTLGIAPGIFVLLFDSLKGAAAVLLASALSAGEPFWMIVGGICAIIGHNWPIYLKFKGGKGVATTIGVVATLVFYPALFAGMIALVVLYFTRYVSLASMVFAILIPIFVLIFDYSGLYIIVTIVMAVLVCIRHRSNIERLRAGTERKLGKRSV